MKKHIITIGGNLGSGKSTAADKTSELLNYTRASTGDFMRKMAKDRGITLEELSKIAETDPSFDLALDEHNREIGEGNKIVIDSRLGFFFIPEAFKVFLYCDPSVAATRILKDAEVNPSRHAETRSGFTKVEEIAVSITARLASERKRYLDLYGIKDHTDPANFDLVINTGLPENTKVAVPHLIVEAYKKWLEKDE